MGIKVSSGEGGSRGIVCAINIASDPSCILFRRPLEAMLCI